ncbi:hypothetical protein JW935_11305 [candidate division KSB1 bacterium]|nr:hypothetical protein [candidate division KSB1 bacterium]
MKKILVFSMLITSLTTIWAQKIVETNILNELIQAYNQFDTAKCLFLLNIALGDIETFDKKDQIEIYKYAAFIAFQDNNATLAEHYFWNIMNIDPTYGLDPVTTSPKVLTLYQKAKIEYLEELNVRLQQIQIPDFNIESSWRAFYPGWEQYHRGFRQKGGILLSSASLTLGGFFYSVVRTRTNRADYISAKAGVEQAYNKYNVSYKNQFYFGYAFLAVWIVSQCDLFLFSTPYLSVSPKSYSSSPLPALGLEIKF